MKGPLSRALLAAGLNVIDVAAQLSVDPKTVNRWLNGRLPYPRHRAALAHLTGRAERDLWPGIDARQQAEPTSDEVITVYSQRCSVPPETWRRLLQRAEHEIDILGYSSLFLAEDAGAQAILRAKANSGVRIRLALGDPDGTHITQRSADEGIDGMMTARILNALALIEPLTDVPGVLLRLHDTVLYNSIYRSDDELLVNTHLYACPASRTPVIHLRRSGHDGMAATYLASFERVWSESYDSRAHQINRSQTPSTPSSG